MKGGRKGGEEDWRRGKKIKGKEKEVAFCRQAGEGGLQKYGDMIFLWTTWSGRGTWKEPGFHLIRRQGCLLGLEGLSHPVGLGLPRILPGILVNLQPP